MNNTYLTLTTSSGNLDETADALQFAMFGEPIFAIHYGLQSTSYSLSDIPSDSFQRADDASDDFLDGMADSLLDSVIPDHSGISYSKSYSFSQLSSLTPTSASLQKDNFYTPIEGEIPRVEPCQAVKCHQTIVVVMDSSGSIGEENYQKELSFVENLLKLMAIKAKKGNLKLCAGLIAYSTDVHVEVDLCCENSLCKVMELFDTNALHYLGGSTNTAGALKVARQMLQAAASYQKVAIVTTDGYSNTGGSPITIAKQMRDEDGTRIMALGVGTNTDDAELMGMSGKNRVTNIASFDEFRGLSNKLLLANGVPSLSALTEMFATMCSSDMSLYKNHCPRVRTKIFSLVDEGGNELDMQDSEGLLLYNGGTVCDDDFNSFAANAICRRMFRPFGHATWKSGLYYSVQSSLRIKLDDVKCTSSDWDQCTFKNTVQNCGHSEDVHITCTD